MVIDISVKSAALFVIQMVCWLGFSAVMFVLFYYTDDPRWKPSKLRHGVFATLVLAAFVLIFGLVQINWIH